MTDLKLNPTLKSLGKRLDAILIEIARLPLSPPIEDLLRQLHEGQSERSKPSFHAPAR
jgi:hypothetical protein